MSISQLEAAVGQINSRGVVVICSLRGLVTGDALLLCLSAHYRIIDAQASLHCDMTWKSRSTTRIRHLKIAAESPHGVRHKGLPSRQTGFVCEISQFHIS